MMKYEPVDYGADAATFIIVSDDALTLASLPSTGYTGGTYTIARQFSTLSGWEDCIDGQGGIGDKQPDDDVRVCCTDLLLD